MNYKLYKQLKDAGFKFEHDEDCDVIQGTGNECYCISLSELIKACGVGFHSLTHSHGKSYAYGFTKGSDLDGATNIAGGESKDDEEAVAKLWLELNKK